MQENTLHDNNMMQCLLMASQGAGYVSPNPMVGAMLVHDGNMIGAGYHMQYGQAHAEVNCIKSVMPEQRHLIPASTLYVTLEPCCHFGKTPPCTDFILANGIKKVVIATRDINEQVNGKGIAALQKAGVEIIEGVMEQQAIALNRRFFTYQIKKRPYIILKWATTADGYVAASNKQAFAITGEAANKINHTWRSHEDAIMVGYNTALLDNPRLNVRHTEGRDPIRIAWDKELQLPNSLNLFDGSQATILYNNIASKQENNIAYRQASSLQEIITDLYKHKAQSMIVEGGPATLQKFIDANLWDEARVIVSDKKIGEGLVGAQLSNARYLYPQAAGADTIHYYAHSNNIYL